MAAGAALRELFDARIGDQPAAADDDDVVGGRFHLAHQVAAEEDGAALFGEALQEATNPADALGVQAVHRLVEDERLWVAEQSCSDAEPLVHAE